MVFRWSLASNGGSITFRSAAAAILGAWVLATASCGPSDLPTPSPASLEARAGQDGDLRVHPLASPLPRVSNSGAGEAGEVGGGGGGEGAGGAGFPGANRARPMDGAAGRGALPREAVQALRAVERGDEAEAAFLLSEALGQDGLDERTRQGLRRKLEPLRSRMLRGEIPTDLFALYTVQAGDSLARICRKLKESTGVLCEVGMLRMLNGLPGDKIFPDQKLRYPTKSVRIEVHKSLFCVRVWLGRILLREYRCGIGKENRTPEGGFVIAERLIDPPWFRKLEGDVVPAGDPRNVLGSRWLGFKAPFAEYGIHGTTDPDSIGKAESNGCIRLRNDAVEELFDFIPRGAAVSILP